MVRRGRNPPKESRTTFPGFGGAVEKNIGETLKDLEPQRKKTPER